MNSEYPLLPDPPLMVAHSFYADKRPQGVCKFCGKPIIRDRWTDTGWAHYESGDTLCGPPQTKAQPK